MSFLECSPRGQVQTLNSNSNPLAATCSLSSCWNRILALHKESFLEWQSLHFTWIPFAPLDFQMCLKFLGRHLHVAGSYKLYALSDYNDDEMHYSFPLSVLPAVPPMEHEGQNCSSDSICPLISTQQKYHPSGHQASQCVPRLWLQCQAWGHWSCCSSRCGWWCC